MENEKENGNTTIALSKDTAKKLSELGSHGDSYEDIILRLLDSGRESQI